ncbi:MAG TPA: hypothetical protein VFM19_00875 [Candidatus Limnocylindria bacterium]|nr:hypothetical protein [Candidatus Limnocylindria bacterium]
MTGALTWARLSFRQQRWELILVAVGTAIVAGVMVWFASALTAMIAANPTCIPTGDAGPSAACAAVVEEYYGMQGWADQLLAFSFAAPFGMGVVLGAPLVAREIEGGTAQLAWTLSRSRVGWLLRRIAFAAVVVAVLLGVLAVTSEMLAAALLPDRDLGHDFQWAGRRGWLIVARGMGALGIGLLVGAAIGRVLPAILASAVVIGLAFTGLSLLHDRWLSGEALIWDQATQILEPGSMYLASGIRTPDGAVHTWSEAQARGVAIEYIDEQGRGYASEADMTAGRVAGTDIAFVIPGSRYPEVIAREAAMAGAAGLAALGLSALVVRRRRPV